MKLVAVESPAKAKTISKYLGGDYLVTASVGHIRDLPKSNKNAVDVAGGFIPHYEIIKGKEKVVAELKRAAEKAEEIILATDPDREGEAIAWHIAQACGFGDERSRTEGRKLKRIVFHEITEEAIREALSHPRDIDENLKTAQEARRVLDRLFGYDLSGLIWRKLRYGLSAGRVQSPALRIIVEREREIKVFQPEKFWNIQAIFKTVKGDAIPFLCAVKLKTETEARTIVRLAEAAAFKVAAAKAEKLLRQPRPPLITSTLQQAASSRLNFSPALTMRLAQNLYEAGLITYMRTDNTNLNRHAIEDATKLIKEKYGPRYSLPRVFPARSKNAQEAHEAIRPTTAATLEAGRSDQEKKLYQLIWGRTMASQMAAAELLKTKIEARADNQAIPPFLAEGAVVAFDGWLRADPKARGEEQELPSLKPNDPLVLQDIKSIGKETEPPRRYSEAGLIKELEKRGIGRPSTYAPIIKTLHDRGYVMKAERALQPTDLGETVNNFLEKHFAWYISDSFTEEMENRLDEIAAGKRGYRKTLQDFYQPFRTEIEAKKDVEKITNLGQAPAAFKCPDCGAGMVIKLGRNGRFLSCENFPKCQGALKLEDKKPAEKLNVKCPACENGELVRRRGRYGLFVACSAYPACTYTARKLDSSLTNHPKAKSS